MMKQITTWLRKLFVPTVEIKPQPSPPAEPVELSEDKPLDLSDVFQKRFDAANDTILQIRSGKWSGTPLSLYFPQCDGYVQFLSIATDRLRKSTSIHLPSRKKRVTLSKFFTDTDQFYVNPSEAHASLANVFCDFVREHTRLCVWSQTHMLTTREINNLNTASIVIKDIEEYLQTLGV